MVQFVVAVANTLVTALVLGLRELVVQARAATHFHGITRFYGRQLRQFSNNALETASLFLAINVNGYYVVGA